MTRTPRREWDPGQAPFWPNFDVGDRVVPSQYARDRNILVGAKAQRIKGGVIVSIWRGEPPGHTWSAKVLWDSYSRPHSYFAGFLARERKTKRSKRK